MEFGMETRYSTHMVCVVFEKKAKSGKHKSKMLNECFLFSFNSLLYGMVDDYYHDDDYGDDGDLLFLG